LRCVFHIADLNAPSVKEKEEREDSLLAVNYQEVLRALTLAYEDPEGEGVRVFGVLRPPELEYPDGVSLEERIQERLDIVRVPDEPPLEGREPEGPIAGMGLQEEVLDGDQAGLDLHLSSMTLLEIFSSGRP
jgi:hypothetical protein